MASEEKLIFRTLAFSRLKALLKQLNSFRISQRTHVFL